MNLSFADSGWHQLSACLAFVSGALIVGGLARHFRLTRGHVFLLYLWHSMFCILYFSYALSNPTDAQAYFLQSFSDNSGLYVGTGAVNHITSIFSQGFGMSYGGVFLVFNIIGCIGLIAFCGALFEMLRNASLPVRRASVFVPLLPSLSFWSVAIGKDSLAFMGAGLACWSVLNIQRRFPVFFLAAVSFLIVRPHIAGLMLICLTLALLIDPSRPLIKRIIIGIIICPITVYVAYLGVSSVGLDGQFSFDDVQTIYEQRQGYNLDGGSSVDISQYSVPLRLLTYLFRPLFFDASGLFGLIVSVENLIYLGLSFYVLFALFFRSSALAIMPKIFFIMFVALSWMILANITSNLGIASRQKTMFLPMLLMVIFSYLGQKKRVKSGSG